MGTTPAREKDASKSGRTKLRAAEEGIVAVLSSRAGRGEVRGSRFEVGRINASPRMTDLF